MSKPLRVGMIGYGFMGRAHSNAYEHLNDFFEVEHRPVLKAACDRKKEKAQAFADNWGYERVETDWRRQVMATTPWHTTTARLLKAKKTPRCVKASLGREQGRRRALGDIRRRLGALHRQQE